MSDVNNKEMSLFNEVRDVAKRADIMLYVRGGFTGNSIAAGDPEITDPFLAIASSEIWEGTSDLDKTNLTFCLGALWGFAAHRLASAEQIGGETA